MLTADISVEKSGFKKLNLPFLSPELRAVHVIQGHYRGKLTMASHHLKISSIFYSVKNNFLYVVVFRCRRDI